MVLTVASAVCKFSFTQRFKFYENNLKVPAWNYVFYIIYYRKVEQLYRMHTVWIKMFVAADMKMSQKCPSVTQKEHKKMVD